WEPEMHNKHHLLRETHPWTDGRRKPTSFQIATYKASLIAEAMNSAKLIEDPLQEDKILQSYNLKRFGFNEVRVATKNFRPDSLLRESGFGCVFKGWIDKNTSTAAKPGTGMVIVVKRLRQKGYQGHEEWLMSTGFWCMSLCPEAAWKIIYSGVMLGAGSSDSQPLSWNLRIKVSLGAAKGLAYLHSPEAKVIYLDSKVSNILIDSLSDFGLAKDGPVNGKIQVSNRVKCTYGYAAPKYMATGNLCSQLVVGLHLHLILIVTIPLPFHLPLLGFTC
ncbi:hypothetical protein RJ640_011636, partial [Escallonia rubra]